MTLYLKALRSGRRATFADYTWPEPGVWVRVGGPLVACEHGLHVCRPDQIVHWLSDELWLAEGDDRYRRLNLDDKTVIRRGRLFRQLTAWDERSARLFAADCAERVLPIFERERRGDDRPRLAIEAARAYVRGEIGDAARAAARDAAGAAAWDAAGAAARAAAWAAAGAAAWAAAGAAARDAARAAARAADAARNAARAATLDAAGAAEKAWQTGHLLDLLDITDDERARLGVAA